MASDRMVRWRIREDELVESWPMSLRYFYIMLWGYVDDWGRGKMNLRLIKAGTHPLDDDVTLDVIDRYMRALEGYERIVKYSVGGHEFFEIVNFAENQRIEYRHKTDVPGPDGLVPVPGKVSKGFQKVPENSEKFGKNPSEWKGREGKLNKREGGEFSPPPPSRYCPTHPNGTPKACHGCQEARLAYEQWQADHQPPPPEAMWDCSKGRHKWVAGNTCALCGETKEAG